jgi:hypothetical protein
MSWVASNIHLIAAGSNTPSQLSVPRRPSVMCSALSELNPRRSPRVLFFLSPVPQPVIGPASNSNKDDCEQAIEVKSDSRDVRFVIAKHSLQRVLENGLPIEALEKNRAAGTGAAPGAIFSSLSFAPEKNSCWRTSLFRLPNCCRCLLTAPPGLEVIGRPTCNCS